METGETECFRLSRACRAVNKHQHCDIVEECRCVCHYLDNDKIGWLKPKMEATIRDLESVLGPIGLRDEDWFSIATVLAVWQCGTDDIRIQHAIGKGPRIIARSAARLRAASIWDGDTWRAPYAEDDSTDRDVIEFVLHCLVAEGKIRAEKRDGEFFYCALPKPEPKREHSARSRRAERRQKSMVSSER